VTLDLQNLVRGVPEYGAWNHAEKIKFFAWFLHSQKHLTRLKAAQIEGCYSTLHAEPPSNISAFLSEMEKRKPKVFLKDNQGYYLAGMMRNTFEAKYGQREITVQVTKLLSELPIKIPNVVERDFLNEALICYRHGAFRAAIVMCWNLAYDHLCEYVLTKHIAAFNMKWPIRLEKHHKKAGVSAIATRDDFSEFKEDQMLEVCKSANIISDDTFKILKEKLGRRNTAAHPNSIKITQLQAEDFISDLVNNVVLALK
jgi:hypothetical protein